jgi:hypothetical protein
METENSETKERERERQIIDVRSNYAERLKRC